MPALAAQGARHNPFSPPIPSNLLHPIFLIGSRKAKVFWTSVPKAPIHEEREMLPAEDEVGISNQRWCLRQPDILWLRKTRASFISVSLLPFERTAAITRDRFALVKTSATDRE